MQVLPRWCECFFWYQLTWVVPDKGQLNGRVSVYILFVHQVENYELEKKLLNENTCSLNSRLLDAQIIICDLQDDLVCVICVENYFFKLV